MTWHRMLSGWRAALFAGLKSLPGIITALLLGGGLVVTGFAAAYTLILRALAGDPAPLEVRVIAVQGLATALLISLGLMGLVLVVLALRSMGRVGQVSATLPGGASVTADFDGSCSSGEG